MATPQSEADVDRDGRSAWGCATRRGRGAHAFPFDTAASPRGNSCFSRHFPILKASSPDNSCLRCLSQARCRGYHQGIEPSLAQRARVLAPTRSLIRHSWPTRPVRVAKRRTRIKRRVTRSAAPLGRETRDGVLGSRLTCARPRRRATGSRASLRSPRGTRHRARRSTAAGLLGGGAH
jgi:hypothetical protein